MLSSWRAGPPSNGATFADRKTDDRSRADFDGLRSSRDAPTSFGGLSQEAIAAHHQASLLSPASSDAPFRTLFDLMPELGWTARPDGCVESRNRRWYEYTGCLLDEELGWDWSKVHDPNMLPLVVARWQQALVSGEPFEMVFPLRRANGAFRWFLTRVTPVRDGEAGNKRRSY